MAKKKIEQLVTVNLPMKYQKSYGIYMKLRWTGGWEVVQVLPGGAVFFSDQIQATDVIKSVDNVKVTFWNYKKIDGLFRDAIKQERTLVLEVVKGPGDNKRQKKEEKERKEERRAIAVLRRIFTNKEERVKLTKSDELQELYEEEEHFIE
ncbi:hypothetical protein L596_019308 [Steinernema carpocapsae]|uniref:PDZ domain-containing protein n=1 Tax=Steinernema carpocapsae TaxID=34508 RepID=A0A4U5MQP0_STECR|nr:hypothetical protein L596_019308 [Steinernema carpocapsae]